MSRCAASFDASLLSADQASLAVVEAAAIEAMAATVKGLAAARVAETGTWKDAGDRSAASHLARTTGTSVGQASEALQTARRLENLAVLATAARAGSLSACQAAAVADAATADPSSESRLVEKARRSSLAELRQECLRTKSAALPDAEARRRSIHDQRFLRSYTDAEGAWNLRMRDNPEVGAEVLAAIAPIRDRLFRAARADGRSEAAEAYAADALAELARSGGQSGARPSRSAKLIVRVDLEALLRGYAMSGEVCELAGFGPVAVSAVRDLLDTSNPFLAAVVTKGEQVVGVAHLGRRPTAAQESALEWLYPTCAVEGCPATTWLENDHRLDWAKTRFTVLDLLDRLCTHHHDLKSLDGWGLVPGHGKRPFVPPDDRRHPRHASSSAA
ncbi:MAG TPA: DUF222 domain-containing protein [Acidimicrobiales bacterium]|nr:DUF222 domain-containing protein [Acidimicrobiales bacterium]